METRIVHFGERFFSTMLVVILVLVVAGLLFHFASSRGWAPAFFQKVGTLTNLQTQAGA